ncbi:MAG: histone deacetylase [Nitrospirae bacterium]|jgi:acetoin utilization deacetylase AcuC-like enzyme|nr:histone deacetylase [Nitrospirota bacterium]
MEKVGFIYDDIFLKHEMPSGHPESPERLVKIIETLKKSDIWDKLIHIKPRMADEKDILRVHTKKYFDTIKTVTGYFDPDTYISKNSFEAAMFSAGAVIEAIDRCKRGEIGSAFCAVRPPGHHAEADRAMGFCIFNNIAIGARFAQETGYNKVFIVDFDVHHGNGTQHIFEEDDSVFYFSTHQYPHYPGTGKDSERGRGKGGGFTYNIPLQSGSGDKDYYYAYRDILPGLIKNFRPDIIMVSAGYDIHASDPLSGINVTSEGMRSIVRGILLRSTTSYIPSLPYVFALEGGYNLNALGESVINTLKEMLKS